MHASQSARILVPSYRLRGVGILALVLSVLGIALAPEAQAQHGSASTVDSIDGTGPGAHSGTIDGTTDRADWYTFYGTSGAAVTMTVSSPGFNSYTWVYETSTLPTAGAARPSSPPVSQSGSTTGYTLSFTLPATDFYTWSIDSYVGGSGSYTVTVAGDVFAVVPPAFTADSPPPATVGTPYTYTYTATGGPAPTFSVASGALPVGLTLDSVTGVLSGTPTTAETASFTVTAANGAPPDATSADSIVVSLAPAFTADSPPGGTVGSAYTYTYTATGDPVPTFSVTSGTLPAGLTLDSTTGILSGTPTAGGTSTFTVTASNGIAPDATSADTVTITAPPVFTTHSPPAGTVGSAYLYTYTATGTPAPTFSVTAGSLPLGLTLNSTTGVLSGLPTTAGTSTFTVTAANGVAPAATSTDTVTVRSAAATTNRGYWLVTSDGGIFTFGDAAFFGSTGAIPLNKPIVGMTATSTGRGYWLVASDGGIFTFGDAAFFGSTGAIPLNKPIVGMTATSTGRGYWLVASDGGIFAFGDAAFFGSTGAITLNKPVVGMTATSTGRGYWLVASDGGIFTFGDAAFFGSTGAIPLNKPIVGMTATSTGRGYWLVASDGGIFAFGDAAFFGSTGAITLNKPVVGMTATSTGRGYWLVASDGGIFAFGDAAFFGSTGAITLNKPVVGMARH